jgi:tRNA (guanine37-N1)-methyltransferase
MLDLQNKYKNSLMHITVATLFPEMFHGPFTESILKRAQENSLLTIDYVNIRDFGLGKHQIVDDTPYGGGAGMVMRVDVLHKAIQYARSLHKPTKQKVVLLDAGGIVFNQTKAKEYATLDHIIFVCGHYEGVDERIKKYVDETVSIGDYVLTGGEIPAMVIVDTVARLVPGVIKEESFQNESFSFETKGIEYPHYTKPQEYEGSTVPDVLLLGNHKKIEEWRKEKIKENTQKYRPDLLENTKTS